MSKPEETWGELPAHEIARRVMLAERSSWTVPIQPSVFSDPDSENQPNKPMEPLEQFLGIPAQIRHFIAKLNGANFTVKLVAENLPEVPLKRVRDYLSGAAARGVFERIPDTNPAQYRQGSHRKEAPLPIAEQDVIPHTPPVLILPSHYRSQITALRDELRRREKDCDAILVWL